MPTRCQRPSRGRARDAASLEAQVSNYIAWREATGSAQGTLAECEWLLTRFLAWCHEHGLVRPKAVSPSAMERYQRALAEARPDGTHHSLDAQRRLLVAVRSLFKWLVRQHVVPWNPAGSLEMPHSGRRLPRAVMTHEAVERVLAQPKVTRRGGLRDRAMLEVLYSTGLRRKELLYLRIHDVDMDQGLVLVREGKGRKDRVVPVGARALTWLRRYLDEVRPVHLRPPDEGWLFLTQWGRRIGVDGFTSRVGRFVRRAGAGPGACHAFRHTMATLMLENGADVRYLEELLGHADIRTTAIYTHVAIPTLRAVHAATHPAEVGLRKRPGT
jgi:integrase/recombinase XerD